MLKTISLELFIARTSGAKEKIADTLSNARETIKLYNRGFFYCFVCDLLSDPTSPHHGKIKFRSQKKRIEIKCISVIIVVVKLKKNVFTLLFL